MHENYGKFNYQCPWIKSYLNTAIPTYLPSVFDCFNDTPAEFSNCSREDITH